MGAKYIVIHFRMRTAAGETADGVIPIPVLPEYAAKILAREHVEHLDILLDKLARLQGYDGASVLYAESWTGDQLYLVEIEDDTLAGADSRDAGEDG